MGDRRYSRPRTPPLVNPARISLPIVEYGTYDELYGVPVRRDPALMPRTGANPSVPIVTTYKVKTDPVPRPSSSRDGSRRRSTLDSTPRPLLIVPPSPRHSVAPGSVAPPSPARSHNRSSDEGEYYTIPATSGRHRSHRPSYSATMDNADMNSSSRDTGRDRSLRVVGGREGAMYPRSRPIHSGSVVRHADTVADDYGDDGYGYTNPRDLVQYDLNQPARYPRQRRESHDSSRSSRPGSIGGYQDVTPRSFDARERGPPPATRGLDRLASRPVYDYPPARLPIPESSSRPSRAEAQYVPEPARRNSTTRRPVTVYQEPDRRSSRDDYYDPRDEERRDRLRRSERYNDGVESRSYGGRSERQERNDYDKRDDYDKRNDDDRTDRKKSRDGLPAGLSVAGAALGLGAVTKSKEESRESRDDREEPRHRREVDEEPRRRREPRDEREPVDSAGRDTRERRHRDDRDVAGDGKERAAKEKSDTLDLTGRNPQERRISRDDRDRDNVPESRSSRKHRGSFTNGKDHDSTSESSAATDEMIEKPNYRRVRRHRDGPAVPFDPKNTMDLRELKEALSKQDASTVAVSPATESASQEATVDKKELRETPERRAREHHSRRDRGRSSSASSRSHSAERRPSLRVVSPPREEPKKPEENKPKGILRAPREKFPEDPAPIREGVAPLKDAKKDGVPPDARWTKISRKLVNPAALEAGKERYEARDDFVIVLRVLSKDEVQGYAEVTQKIRALREEEDNLERQRRRRERHQRHRTHRHGNDEQEHADRGQYQRPPRKEREDTHSESDTTEEDPTDREKDRPKAIEEARPRRTTFTESSMNGTAPAPTTKVPPAAPAAPIPAAIAALPPDARSQSMNFPSALKEDPKVPGTFTGYVRNPPPPMAGVAAGRRE